MKFKVVLFLILENITLPIKLSKFTNPFFRQTASHHHCGRHFVSSTLAVVTTLRSTKQQPTSVFQHLSHTSVRCGIFLPAELPCKTHAKPHRQTQLHSVIIAATALIKGGKFIVENVYCAFLAINFVFMFTNLFYGKVIFQATFSNLINL